MKNNTKNDETQSQTQAPDKVIGEPIIHSAGCASDWATHQTLQIFYLPCDRPMFKLNSEVLLV